ncbi:MAG: hypothetical protein AW11_00902 [Candidatus Accumulibacter regalis]|uniref:Uncharacterized protein n=1 Tax=Accumulibacter regalis TaxID=522306 RepID=A0A011RG54_ACCRE|nr:hypothetical protein [Accumulibacter sp.]EXI90199.1 MAG: hypothetical protein AW11_00902 [Candidatus Accumulibacter regalis]HRE72284.1 hypothetical protein [Accumulibacter sp.]
MPNIPGASAHLVLLPSASNPPVVQAPRRGRYPRGVISLRQARENVARRERFASSLHEMEMEVAMLTGKVAGMHYVLGDMIGKGEMA